MTDPPARVRGAPAPARRGHLALRALVLVAAAYATWQVAAYFAGGLQRRHRLEAAWMIFTVICVAAVALNRSEGGRFTTPGGQLASTPRGWVAFLAAAVSLGLYWPALGIGLLGDDFVAVSRPLSSALWPGSWEFYRPVPLAIWSLLYPIGGAVALHLLNIALHGVNAVLVAALVLRCRGEWPAALLAGCAFLFYPAAVEPVAWNSGIFDVSATTFTLAFVHCAIVPARPRLAVLAIVAALLSKETAVAAPLLASALARVTRVDWRVVGAGVLLVAVVGLGRFATGTEVPLGDEGARYFLKEIAARSYGSLAAPWTRDELLRHPVALGILPCAAIVMAVAAYSVSRRASLAASLTALWVVAGALPVMGLFFIAPDLRGSRYLYLPLAGWAVFLSVLLNGIAAVRVRRVVATVIVAVMAGVGTWGVRTHLGSWVEAAALRERTLDAASAALTASGCSSGQFEQVPVYVDGAYVFVNGFREALAQRTGVPDAAEAAVPSCRFRWDADHFRRIE